MAQSSYNEALRRLLIHEGGYTNHPADPGGPTKYGITIFDYRKYINPKGTADDVRRMSVDQAKRIYKEKYWDALNCDALPPGVDYMVFDYGVNSGLGRAGRVLRRLVDLPDNNWTVTPAVIEAVNKRNPVTLIRAMSSERMRFLKGLKTWGTFGKGWSRRVKEVTDYSLELVVGNTQAPSPIAGMVVGKPGINDASPVQRMVAYSTAAFAATFGAMYQWAIAHPILAALILEAVVVLVVFAIMHRENKTKPKPVPVPKPKRKTKPKPKKTTAKPCKGSK